MSWSDEHASNHSLTYKVKCLTHVSANVNMMSHNGLPHERIIVRLLGLESRTGPSPRSFQALAAKRNPCVRKSDEGNNLPNATHLAGTSTEAGAVSVILSRSLCILFIGTVRRSLRGETSRAGERGTVNIVQDPET